MKNKLYIIFICSLISSGLHLYLSSKSYSLFADSTSNSSICYINETINCNNVLSSNYSHFIGIPIANWGFSIHVIILFLLLSLLIGWNEKSSETWLTIHYLILFSASASFIMWGISGLILHLYCPFCIVLYILSFITLLAVLTSLKQIFLYSSIKKVFSFIFPKLILMGIIIGVLLHLIFMNVYDIKSLKKTVKQNVQDWIYTPKQNYQAKALFVQGPPKEKALITLTEFADFLCSHCRNSYFILKTFKPHYPQMRIEYFSYPLDKCKSSRTSCALTRATYCAEKQNQGWNMHELIFKSQKEFISFRNKKKALNKIKQLSHQLPINWDKWSKCISDPDTYKMLQEQIMAGEKMGVKGTPTLFINNKYLPQIYFTQTIKAIIKYLKK